MRSNQIFRIVILVVLSVVFLTSLLLYFAMNNYVNTYNETNSFMTLENAKFLVICLIVILGVTLFGILFTIFTIIEKSRKTK